VSREPTLRPERPPFLRRWWLPILLVLCIAGLPTLPWVRSGILWVQVAIVCSNLGSLSGPARGLLCVPNSLKAPPPGKELPSVEALQRMVEENAQDPSLLLATYSHSNAFSRDWGFLGLREGSVVADIGSGTGGFALVLLTSGAPFETLYEVDVHAPSLDFARFMVERTALPGSDRVVFVESELDDIGLPPSSVDVVVVMADIEDTSLPGSYQPLLASMARSMRPGSRLFRLFSQKTATPEWTEAMVGEWERAGFVFRGTAGEHRVFGFRTSGFLVFELGEGQGRPEP
jgi:SAM-dependent methyltransferase